MIEKNLEREKGIEPSFPDCPAFFKMLLVGGVPFTTKTSRKNGRRLERAMRIELTLPAWKAGVLPLNYARVSIVLSSKF